MRNTRKKKREAILKNSRGSRWWRSTDWGVVTRCVQETGKLPKQVFLSRILRGDGRAGVKAPSDRGKRLKNTIEDGETSRARGLEELIIENYASIKSNLQVWCNPNTDSKVTLQGHRKAIQKCMWLDFYVFLFLKLDSQFKWTHLTLSFHLICLNINFENLIPLWMKHWLCGSDRKPHDREHTMRS